MRIFGKGFNFSQDGPGNRLVYHLSGCNMRCWWCSNPDGMDAGAGEERTVASILEECESCRALFFGGGGVTFTGGEATCQHRELLAVLQGLKARGIHTAIETNGTSSRLAELLEYVDYLIMDFKHHDSQLLKHYTGVGNEEIKHNFERHCATGRQQHIRIPLINGVNTAEPAAFAAYFSRFDTRHTVFEFLPYHEYGKEKWTEAYRIQDGFITEETLALFEEIFRAAGLQIITT